MKTRLFRPGKFAVTEASRAEDASPPNRGKIRFVRPLDIAETPPGLHEKAEAIDQPVYRISWQKRPFRLLGRWTLPGRNHVSGKFVRVSPDHIKMPPEALGKYRLATNGSRMGEVATFIDTELRNSHVGVIMAVKNDGHWWELSRWYGSWRELGLARTDISDV